MWEKIWILQESTLSFLRGLWTLNPSSSKHFYMQQLLHHRGLHKFPRLWFIASKKHTVPVVQAYRQLIPLKYNFERRYPLFQQRELTHMKCWIWWTWYRFMTEILLIRTISVCLLQLIIKWYKTNASKWLLNVAILIISLGLIMKIADSLCNTS